MIVLYLRYYFSLLYVCITKYHYIDRSGIIIIASKYNNIPNVPKLTTEITTKPNRTIEGSIPKHSANPPQTPAIFLSVRDL